MSEPNRISDNENYEDRPSTTTKRIRRLLGKLEENIGRDPTTPEERREIRAYNMQVLKMLFGLSIIVVLVVVIAVLYWISLTPQCALASDGFVYHSICNNVNP